MKFNKIIFILIIFTVFWGCVKSTDTNKEEFSFILVADWRDKATEPFHNSKYYQGALETIKTIGQGAFMISPGDIEPAEASAKLIEKILGKDYPWYPVVGNHEIEDPNTMTFLREFNKGGTSLANVVRKGPPGCEETTYSFDYGKYHFVVINQYFDGKSDIGTDGDITDALYEWLKTDLEQTDKKHIFISGHEPIISVPDMDNGRHRHVGDSLDKYPKNSFRFFSLLKKHNVLAYLHGHTHSTSYSNINGLWQFDCGHARGIELIYPQFVFDHISSSYEENKAEGITLNQTIETIYKNDTYNHKKVVYYMELTNGIKYKKLPYDDGLKALKEFYNKAVSLSESERKNYFKTYWNNWDITRSSFMKFHIFENKILVDLYRNDAIGGAYTLTETIKLK